MDLEIKQRGSIGPVTALSVCGSKVLAGSGRLIKVHNSEYGFLETCSQGLSISNIHGIRSGPVLDGTTYVCLFGGKQSSIIAIMLNSSDSTISAKACSAEGDFEDWLWDAVWLQKGDMWTVGLALAHNVVLHWDWKTNRILNRVTCTEKCILYCARFIGSSWNDLTLAAGTVFHQVVLWSVSDSNGWEIVDNLSATESTFGKPDNFDPPRKVLTRLTGHKGVIFSIHYNPKLHKLCSVSDDRSIRVWQLSVASEANGMPLSSLDWSSIVIKPALTLFGHSARVWDVVLLSDKIVSVGEDARCLVWNYKGEILHQFRGHRGRSIWSLAASEDESFVVTGGGDASIRQWHLKDKAVKQPAQVIVAIPDHMKASEKDFARSLILWDYDTVVLATNEGVLLSHSINNGIWKKLFHNAAFSSYVILALSPNKTFLTIGSITGLVIVLKRHKGLNVLHQCMTQPHQGKVCGLTWVDDCHYVTTGLNGHCVVTKVHLDVEAESDSLSVRPVAWLELPTSQHRWVTAGCFLLSLLVCGDRSGSIYSYCLPLSADETNTCRPQQIFSKIHGSAGVTWICYHDNTIFTAGRDGHYRRWAMKNGSLELLNTSRVLKGFDWIDRLVFLEDEFQIMGFYSSKFMVWSVTKGDRLLEVECGGGHRAWDCMSQVQGQACRFIFLKARQVVLVTSSQSNRQTIIRAPLHGSKLWAMKQLYTYESLAGNPLHLVCMASEDTTLSIEAFWLEKGSLHWSSQHTMHGHLSSVRALAVVDGMHNTGTALPRHHVHSRTKEHGQKQWTNQAVCDKCVDSSHVRGEGFLEDAQDFGHVSQNEVHDMLSAPGIGSRSQVVKQLMDGRRPQSLTKTLFSGGGRAQIQAWRVCVVLKTKACVAQETADTGQDFRFLESSGALMRNLKSPDSLKLLSGNAAVQNLVHTSYKHLGGCFLGEARHKQSYKPWKARYLKLDPETRIMDLAAIAAQSVDSRLPAGAYLLAAAGSDGVLRLFLFEEKSCIFLLLCQSSHHNGCLLKVYIHLLPLDGKNRPILLSAATDGKIALWDLQPVCSWLQQHFFAQPEAGSANSEADVDCDKEPVLLEDDDILWHSEVMEACKHQKCSNHKTHSDVASESCSNPDASYVELSNDLSEDSKATSQFLSRHRFAKDPAASVAKHDTKSKSSDEEENEEELSCMGPTPEVNATNSRNNRAQYLTERQQTSLQVFLGGKSTWEWTPNKSVKSHQSGINSLHVKSVGGRQIMIASGGDDNAVTVHRLRFEASVTSDGQQQLFNVESTVARCSAHAAQITGVWILTETLVVTASIDQRVSLWHLLQEGNTFKISMKGSQFVDIADLSNIDVWQNGNVVHIGVCGEGVALLTLDL